MTKINQNNQVTKIETIRDHIIIYQTSNNKEDLYNNLISYPIEGVIKQELMEHDIKHLQLNDKLMNGWLTGLKRDYRNLIAREDIEDAVLDFITLNNVWDNADVSKSANEVARYVNKAFYGHVYDYFKEQLHFNEDVVTEHVEQADGEDNAFDDGNYSVYNTADYQNWIEQEYDTSYNQFIDVLGGLESILTKQQHKVLNLSHTMSQRAIADELGVSEANISKTLNTADKRIKKAYLSHRAARIHNSNDKQTVDTIKEFLNQFDAVAAVDVSNSFDYFEYIINWISSNVDKNEFVNKIGMLQKNKMEYDLTVTDIIFDNIKKNQRDIVMSVYEARVIDLDDDVTFTSRHRNSFNNAVIQALYSYIEGVEDGLDEFFGIVVDKFAKRNNEKMARIEHDDYDDVIDLIK